MGHGPVAMMCSADRAARLYVSITVNRRSFFGGSLRCEKLFTRHLKHRIALSVASIMLFIHLL